MKTLVLFLAMFLASSLALADTYNAIGPIEWVGPTFDQLKSDVGKVVGYVLAVVAGVAGVSLVMSLIRKA
jgi:hypothetical protein